MPLARPFAAHYCSILLAIFQPVPASPHRHIFTTDLVASAQSRRSSWDTPMRCFLPDRAAGLTTIGSVIIRPWSAIVDIVSGQ